MLIYDRSITVNLILIAANKMSLKKQENARPLSYVNHTRNSCEKTTLLRTHLQTLARVRIKCQTLSEEQQCSSAEVNAAESFALTQQSTAHITAALVTFIAQLHYNMQLFSRNATKTMHDKK